jgi:hypothetical protein
MSSTILADRDVNTSSSGANGAQQHTKADVKSMEYHRQVLQSKLDDGKYVITSSIPRPSRFGAIG